MQLSAYATGSVTLAWNASTDPSVVGYNVYYGGASGAYTNEICAGNATNATISGLIQGTTYYFAATTYAASGLESPFSSEVSYLVPMNTPIVNQPPTLNAIGNLTINENAGLQTVSLSGITSGATNENQTLAVTAVSSNTGLIPNPTVNYTSPNTNGTLTFTPVVNGNGTATITVTVNDGGTSNNIVTQSFTVTVNAVNNQPTLNAIGNLTINENAGLQTVSLSGITSGATNEIQTLTVTAVSSNTGLIPNPTVYYTNANTTGKLTFTPTVNGNGTATITVTVNDGGASNNIVTQSFTVTVNAVNNQPTLNAISNLTINENAGLQTVSLSGITSGATNEIQTLTVTAVSSNTGLIPNPTVNYTSPNTNGTLTFTPVANATGTATITVTVNDGGTSNNIVTRTFTVTVNAANQPPTLNAISNLTLSKNAGLQTVNLSGITSGATNEIQTLTVTAVSSNLTLIPNPTVNYTSPNTNGTLTFTPVTNATGTATIAVTVNDGQAQSNIITRTFTVTINAGGNQPPTLNAISNLTINENGGLQTVSLSGITSGATNEIQTLKVTATSSNPALISTPSVRYTSPNTNGTLTFTPVANATGTGTITVTVNDGGASNNIVTQTFTVTVLPPGASKPSFTSPLTNKVVVAGKTATFSVAATGTAPLQYQWKFNGANLALATNAALTLSGITTNQAGTYSVAVSNVAGSTNSTATLMVYATAASTLASAAHASGQFALTVSGVPGYQYVVQASTNIVNWVPVQTNTAPFTFVDTNASKFGQRFYRSVYAP